MEDVEGILQKLEELNISYDKHEHEAVMTCEAQSNALSSSDGAVTKNLLLKDKKGRLLLVTALSTTSVSLNLLSHRCGTGKGGLRFASAEEVREYLGVEPGSLTPLALTWPKAEGVAFLMDRHISSVPRVFVHPLVNTASLAMAPSDLDRFLKSLGRAVHYADLTAEPVIDRLNPPDLKKVIDAAAPIAKRETEEPVAQAPAPAKKAVSKSAPSAKPAANAGLPDILNVLSLARVLAAEAQSSNSEQFEDSLLITLNALRNAAYTQGFQAARVAAAVTAASARCP